MIKYFTVNLSCKKVIGHFPFIIFHLIGRAQVKGPMLQKWKMRNDKWKMTNGLLINLRIYSPRNFHTVHLPSAGAALDPLNVV
jgi:hypothetical protein